MDSTANAGPSRQSSRPTDAAKPNIMERASRRSRDTDPDTTHYDVHVASDYPESPPQRKQDLEEDEDELLDGTQTPSMYRDGRKTSEDDFDRRGVAEHGQDATYTPTLSVEQRKALWWRNVFVTGIFIAAWYGFATLLSLYNKWMFTPEYYNFPFPLFVTFCHMIVQFTLAAVIREVWADKFKPVEMPSRKDYVTKVLPTAMATGGDIGLSNMSLKIITLSLYTMVKSSALLFVLLFAFLFHIETPSLRLISVILLISFGVFLMVFNTTDVSIPGLIMVFAASALSGLRWALTELVMHKKAMGLSNPFATIYWLAPLMAVVIGVVSMLVEGWFNVIASDHFQGGAMLKTIGVIVFPGFVAFCMVASEYFIIHRAGSVPLSIAGIFKEVTTISISAWVFGDQLTQLNIIGVVVTVCGIALYTFHKYQKSVSTPPEETHGGDYARVDTVEDADRFLEEHAPERVQMHELRQSEGSPDPAERTQRLRDDFEGWDRDEEWSDDAEEVDAEEVERRMAEKQRLAKAKGD